MGRTACKRMHLLEVGVLKLGGIRRGAGKGNFLLLSDHDNVRFIFFGGPEIVVGNEGLSKGWRERKVGTNFTFQVKHKK